MNYKLKSGDIVYSNTHNCKMTVATIVTKEDENKSNDPLCKEGSVLCQWSDEYGMYSGYFDIVSLSLVSE